MTYYFCTECKPAHSYEITLIGSFSSETLSSLNIRHPFPCFALSILKNPLLQKGQTEKKEKKHFTDSIKTEYQDCYDV